MRDVETKFIGIVVCLCAFTASVMAGPTIVGNGDSGGDLEGATPIKSGPIVDAKKEALKLLEKLHVRAVPGLGRVIPELKNSPMFISKQNVRATIEEDNGIYHQNLSGFVYARTFAEPGASTRFFPAATKLDQDQLVALHIHEALHRALPESVNQKEDVVSKITLAITSPETSYDRIQSTVLDLIPEADLRVVSKAQAPPAPKEAHMKQPSNLGYEFRSFLRPTQPSDYVVYRMHQIHSHLYPFGNRLSPLGIGLGASLIDGPGGTLLGPLNLSARARIWSRTSFHISLWGDASLNTLSSGEIKNSPFGRDIYTLGVSLRKEMGKAYVENYISVSSGGETNQKIGNVDYKYEYGEVYNVKLKAGIKAWKIQFGGFLDLHLSDYFKVTNAAFSHDSGRYRLVSAGPEVAYVHEDFSVSLLGRFILDSTKNANFDQLGDLLRTGVGQGSIGAAFKWYF